MQRIGIRELKEQASQVLRKVRDEGDSFEITYHGRVVARIVPVAELASTADTSSFWASWDELSQEISSQWPNGVSSVDAVREQRRG